MPKEKELFFTAVRALLRPVARFCVKRGLKIQDAYELFKIEMISAAKDVLRESGNPSSSSRLSVLTGLQRRDVDRIQDEPEATKGGSDLLSRVVGQWQSDKQFSSKSKPRLLTVEGAQSEFASLVGSVSKNLNPYTVLFELERNGLIERSVKGITLKKLVLEVSADAADALKMMATDLDTLREALEENIFERQKVPQLHATTNFDNVDPASFEEVKRWLLNQGKTFHAEARRYLANLDRDINKNLSSKKPGITVSVTTFGLTRKKK